MLTQLQKAGKTAQSTRMSDDATTVKPFDLSEARKTPQKLLDERIGVKTRNSQAFTNQAEIPTNLNSLMNPPPRSTPASRATFPNPYIGVSSRAASLAAIPTNLNASMPPPPRSNPASKPSAPSPHTGTSLPLLFSFGAHHQRAQSSLSLPSSNTSENLSVSSTPSLSAASDPSARKPRPK